MSEKVGFVIQDGVGVTKSVRNLFSFPPFFACAGGATDAPPALEAERRNGYALERAVL